MAKEVHKIVKLPEPAHTGKVSVEAAIKKRRSLREYSPKPLELSEVSQLLWAAQGVTDQRGFRTAPSAGALYPLEVYLVADNVNDLEEGVYRYRPDEHALERVVKGGRKLRLCLAAWAQQCVRNAPAVLVIAAAYKRTTGKYGNRGVRYVQMEAGHAAQNIYLQAVSLGLGTVVVGAFSDRGVRKAIGAPKSEEPLCVMPVGRK